MFFCSDCATSKSTNADVNRRSTRDRDPPHPFHTFALDIWGPTSTPDLSSNRYVLAVYYNTAALVGILLTHKSDASSDLCDILAVIISFGHDNPRRTCIDNDYGFLSAAFANICRSASITIEKPTLTLIGSSPALNVNGAPSLTARKPPFHTDLLDRLWGHAFLAMIYLRNRS
jgi:hypothetical protein